MHRCYVDPAIWSDSEVLLSSASEHHLVNVLRVAAGEMIELFDGKGRQAVARVTMERGRKAILKVEKTSFIPRPLLSISLLQALPKGARMDLIIEKATELGVAAIHPVVTERTVVRLNDSAKKEDRRERWQRIAINAAEQSGVKWIPEIKPVTDFDHVLSAGHDCDIFLVGSLGSDARPLRKVLCEAREKKPLSAAILIGPEGDLSPLELKKAADAGAIPVGFGPNVFRVETAAIFAISVLAYEFGSSSNC